MTDLVAYLLDAQAAHYEVSVMISEDGSTKVITSKNGESYTELFDENDNFLY